MYSSLGGEQPLQEVHVDRHLRPYIHKTAIGVISRGGRNLKISKDYVQISNPEKFITQSPGLYLLIDFFQMSSRDPAGEASSPSQFHRTAPDRAPNVSLHRIDKELKEMYGHRLLKIKPSYHANQSCRAYFAR